MHISDLSSAVCSVDLPPAGTHAETVDGAPIGAMMRQAVGRRAQHRMPRAIAVARPVDPALRMLDPHADGKGLRLDMHAPPMQHFEGDRKSTRLNSSH